MTFVWFILSSINCFKSRKFSLLIISLSLYYYYFIIYISLLWDVLKCWNIKYKLYILQPLPNRKYNSPDSRLASATSCPLWNHSYLLVVFRLFILFTMNIMNLGKISFYSPQKRFGSRWSWDRPFPMRI